jgi:hypothetical protein
MKNFPVLKAKRRLASSEGKTEQWRIDAQKALNDARLLCACPPTFGDIEQAKANRWLVAVNEYASHLAGCWGCQNHIECTDGWYVDSLVFGCAWLVMEHQ